MTTCRYCNSEVVWVPTVEGVRPFNPPKVLDSDAPVVVMKRHDCESRKQFLAGAAQKFMQDLYRDPEIMRYALTLVCEKCGAVGGRPCRDLRKGQDRPNKNPHKERMIAGARWMQENGVE